MQKRPWWMNGLLILWLCSAGGTAAGQPAPPPPPPLPAGPDVALPQPGTGLAAPLPPLPLAGTGEVRGPALLAAQPVLLPPVPAPRGLEDLSPEVLQRLDNQQLFKLLTLRQTLGQAQHEHDAPVEIIVPVAFFLTLILGIALALFFSWRKERQRHETVRFALERGAPLPPELLAPPRRPRSDLRTGLILAAAGLGLLLFLLLEGDGSWGIGLIPLLIGAGYLVAWRLERPRPLAPGASGTPDPPAPPGGPV